MEGNKYLSNWAINQNSNMLIEFLSLRLVGFVSMARFYINRTILVRI